jgi:hypothetical protein
VSLDAELHAYSVPSRRLPGPVPSITGVIDSLELGFTGQRRMSTDALEAARQRGSYVHACAALRALDDLDLRHVADEYAGWVQAMLLAYDQLQLRPLLAEEPLYCPTWDYAGQLDFWGWAPALVRPPGVVLIEWKTGDYTGADMQLGAQANLMRANYPGLGPLECYVVSLRADGSYQAQAMAHEEGWQDFAAARRLYARLRRRR